VALRVAAFTAGRTVPAARLRVRQYIAPLAEHGIALREFPSGLGGYPPRNRVLRPAWLAGTLVQRLPQLAAAATADIVLFQRELVSTLPSLEGLSRRPRVVDVDDSVHLFRGGLAARRLARLADLVIVGNSWLAEIWRQWAAAVEILPTAVDTERYRPAPFPTRAALGWIGTAGNLHYLHAIGPALAQVVARFPEVEIAVCCDQKPALSGLPVRYVRWSEEAEAGFLASISIGLMPLEDGPWERGKCSLKMLLYMAAGRPCVASPVGMNKEVLRHAEIGRGATTVDEWTDALCGLLTDPDGMQRLGQAGREVAVARYSVDGLAPRLADLLRRVA
jgi:glycosyltransferase involved in cell wall biosynthesis